jgi:hypothetical protein
MARLVVLLLVKTDARERDQQLCRDLGMLRLHLPPARPMFQHRIENGEQLAQSGRERHH